MATAAFTGPPPISDELRQTISAIPKYRTRSNNNTYGFPYGHPRWRPVLESMWGTFPYSAIGRIRLIDSQGFPSTQGTGWFIDSKTVVTAAHVLYPSASHASTGFWTEVYLPEFGKFYLNSDRRHHPRWSGGFDFDIACFKVDREHSHILTISPINTKPSRVRICGYPSRYEGMREHEDIVGDIIGGEITYRVDTDEGQSGSPVLLTDTQEVVGINVCGLDNNLFNHGLLITDDILRWIVS